MPALNPPRDVQDRLDSWKEIAAYLGRGVRTVQRWERTDQLPVHRLPHDKRASVFAYKDELATWWEARRHSLEDTGAHREIPNAIAGTREWRFRQIVAASIALTAAAALGISVSRLIGQGATRAMPVAHRVTRASTLVSQPALSPDGNTVAFVSTGQDGTSSPQIWIQRGMESAAEEITRGPTPHTNPSFSADGTRFIFEEISGGRHRILEESASGGAARTLLENAKDARFSPDGKSIVFVDADSSGGLVVVSSTGTQRRAIATELLDPLHPVWSPDSAYILVNARHVPNGAREWFVVSHDNASVRNTGIIERLRMLGFNDGWLTVPPAWRTANEIVFSGNTVDGWSLWRQPLVSGAFRAARDPERLTTGTTMDWWPSAANGHLVFVASHPDTNLWSLPVGPDGIVRAPRERFTDRAGLVGFASTSRDGTKVVFTSDQTGNGDVFLKDVASGKESGIATGPERQAYSVISPSGGRVAYGVVRQGATPARPIYVVSTTDGRTRKVCDDCGRPRDWFPDERQLLIERFGSSPHAFSALNVERGSQIDLITSADHQIANPRLAPDGRWIAFDATPPGGTSSVVVARVDQRQITPQTSWSVAAVRGSNPFWSADGAILYFVSADAELGTRAVILGRRFDRLTGVAQGDPFDVYAASDLIVPVWTSGSSPAAASDRIVVRLTNLRGEVWQLR